MTLSNHNKNEFEISGGLTASSSNLHNTIIFPATLRHDFFLSFVTDVAKFIHLHRQEKTEKPLIINILINSHGGCLRTAFAIRNYISALRQQKVIVRTIVPSFAFSAGSYIASSGSKGFRYAFPEAEIMIHSIQSVLFGDFYGDLQKGYARLTADMKIYLSSFAFEMAKDENNQVTKEGHREKLELLEDMCQNSGSWLNAQQSKEKGLIDHVQIPIFKVFNNKKSIPNVNHTDDFDDILEQ